MSDIPCIYEMELFDKEDQLKEDILNGKALDVLICLLSESKTLRELSRELSIPILSVQLYINRLLNAKLVRIESTSIIDGKIEKVFGLVSKDIEIMNHIKNSNSINGQEKEIELSAQHFSSITRQAIRNISHYKDRNFMIKAYFIKTDDVAVKEFKKELEALFEKYQSLEHEDAVETYGFISVLAPYGAENR